MCDWEHPCAEGKCPPAPEMLHVCSDAKATRPTEGCVLLWHLWVGSKSCLALGCGVSPSLVSGDCRPCLAERWLAALGEVAVVLSWLFRAAACAPQIPGTSACPGTGSRKAGAGCPARAPTFVIAKGFPCESRVIHTREKQHHVSETDVASCT